MKSEWQQFLVSCGAQFDGSTLTGFDAPPDSGVSESAIVDLSDFSIVEVSGKDAGVFLQDHFVNDVQALTSGAVQLSGYCSTKGRLLATFYLALIDDTYLLFVPTDVAGSIVQRLNMFARMPRTVGKQMIGKITPTDANLLDRTGDLQVFGLIGEPALALLDSIDPGASTDQVFRTSSLTVIKVPDSDRCICFGDVSACQTSWASLGETVRYATGNAWQLADIRGGVPFIVEVVQDKVVPQMANLHVLGGVSFTKGCYPGQEIVARMQYLGKLKRQMVRYGYEGAPLEVGSTVASGDDKDAGLVLASATTSDNNCESLVVVKVSAREAGFQVVGPSGSRPLRELALPYSLDEDDGPVDGDT